MAVVKDSMEEHGHEKVQFGFVYWSNYLFMVC